MSRTRVTELPKFKNLSSLLSNKPSVTDHGSNSTSLLNTSLSEGIHICSNWIDYPPGLTDAQGTCISTTFLRFGDPVKYWGYRIYLPINDQKIYINRCVQSVWDGWEPISTAKSPEEYDLPLASGIVNNSPAKSVYFKDQFGVVTVSIHTHGETDIPNGTVISIIPDGYRPKYGLGVYSQGAFISFDANGNVVLYGDSGQSIPSGNWIAANVSFLACKA